MRITLEGTPPSTSNIYKYRSAGKFIMGYMSAEGKQRKQEYQWQMKSQWKRKITDEALKLKVKYYFKGKRNRDIDNFSKLWMDAGTGIIWVDDGQITELYLLKSRDDINPRIEIDIYGENELQEL